MHDSACVSLYTDVCMGSREYHMHILHACDCEHMCVNAHVYVRINYESRCVHE